MTVAPGPYGTRAVPIEPNALASPVLVLGGRSQVGYFLLGRLARAGVDACAAGRGAAPPWLGAARWTRADLHVDALPDAATILGAGPLDGLVAWLERERPRPRVVVALSSTSVHTKADSDDPAERALVRDLRDAEARLAAWCGAHGAAWTTLRPTLVYGCGLDANLTRLARLARRWRVVPLPGRALGLRQPVHADDVAAAMLAAAARPAGRVLDLPGGETLAYRDMVARVLACLPVRARLVTLPVPLVRAAVRVLRLVPGYGDVGAATVERVARDLVFDGRPAQAALGWTPRPFRPDAAMFEPPR
jgi:nucleoside-diphosphate-sugar epimerase